MSRENPHVHVILRARCFWAEVRGEVWGALGDELAHTVLGALGEFGGYMQGFHNNDPDLVGLVHVAQNQGSVIVCGEVQAERGYMGKFTVPLPWRSHAPVIQATWYARF